jgi:hypothetical protein
MHQIWFKRLGWLYLPVHLMGLLISLLAVALNIIFFIAIDLQSSSVSDTLLNFFVYFTCVGFWWKWVADKTSKKTIYEE